MTALQWDKTGERFYETGVNKGVLYVASDTGTYPKGVVWNGLTSVSQSPEGAESNPVYADNIKYLNLVSAEDFKASIEAYTYPVEFEECDGSKQLVEGVLVSQQARKSFGLSYQTRIGNDIEGTDKGYKIHLVYGCLAAPSERAYSTINDSPEAITFSWDVSTTAVEVGVPGFKPTAHIVIDSTKTDAEKLKALEAVLYGSDSKEANLPLPKDVYTILGGTAAPAATNG